MESSPAFQFYPKDFLADENVQRMTLTEMGAYMKLMCVCWLKGSLPNDTRKLAGIVGMPKARFERMWPNVLRECFTEDADRLTHKRLDDERRKQREHRRRQSDNAHSRWNRMPRHSDGTATALPRHEVALPPQCSSSPSSSPSPSTTAKAVVARAPLHVSHRNHAHCGRVCLPAPLFNEFMRRRNHDDAWNELSTWASDVEREWGPDGPKANEEPGDAWAFWKARYEEKWPSKAAGRPATRLPAWAVGE